MWCNWKCWNVNYRKFANSFHFFSLNWEVCLDWVRVNVVAHTIFFPSSFCFCSQFIDLRLLLLLLLLNAGFNCQWAHAWLSFSIHSMSIYSCMGNRTIALLAQMNCIQFEISGSWIKDSYNMCLFFCSFINLPPLQNSCNSFLSTQIIVSDFLACMLGAQCTHCPIDEPNGFIYLYRGISFNNLKYNHHDLTLTKSSFVIQWKLFLKSTQSGIYRLCGDLSRH